MSHQIKEVNVTAIPVILKVIDFVCSPSEISILKTLDPVFIYWEIFISTRPLFTDRLIICCEFLYTVINPTVAELWINSKDIVAASPGA